MSSAPMCRVLPRTFALMTLSAAAALFFSPAPARSDVVSANGSSVSSGFIPGTEQQHDHHRCRNGQRVKRTLRFEFRGLFQQHQYHDGPDSHRPISSEWRFGRHAFTVNVPVMNGVTNPGTQAVVLPRQLNLAAGNNQVSLVLKNSTGGASLSVTGSSVNVTGYTSTAGVPTANGPGSASLAVFQNAGGTGTVPGLIVNVPGNANAQGLYSLNTSLTINNNVPASQTVTATYTVGGVPWVLPTQYSFRTVALPF